jgi:hypothetical protein
MIRLHARRSMWTLLTALVLWSAVLAAAKIKIQANREKDADFSHIKTYAWLPSPPPTMEVAPGVMRDPRVIQKELEPWIVGEADRQLATHGWKRVPGPDADVQIVYYLAHGAGFNASTIGEYYQYATGYALVVSPFIAPTNYVQVYEEGTLIIDVVEDRRAIWRGTATTRINRENSDEKRRQTVEDAVKKLIERLPSK